MTDPDRLVVATFVLLFLGGSFLLLVTTFATTYLIPAGVVYALLAVVLVWRILTKG